jgi:endonuclease G, mitochondrial
MAQKRNTAKKKPTRKKTNLGKLSLGLLLVVVFGYGAMAIWEGKIDTSFLNNNDDPEVQNETIEQNPGTNSTPNAEEKDLEAFDLYFTKAFDFAWPMYSTEQAIIERPYFTLRYNETHEQADWVAHQLFADSLKHPKFQRKDNFREDKRIKTGSAALADYKGSGFDRGHLAPAADFSYSEFALSQSFFMSNMSPQNPSFNRGIWKKLEEQIRDWAIEHDHLYVITGPVLNNTFETIGANEVSIPDMYYKIVLDIDKPGIKAIAFLMKNEKSGAELSSFAVTINEIESLTGLDFFPSMSDELEEILESSLNTSEWF